MGESGSGKSVTAYSILNLVPDPPGKIVSGEIIFKGKDLTKLSGKELQNIRGKEIAMIFQEPMTSLNPVLKIGDQITEAILQHNKITKKEAGKKAVELLEHIGVADAKNRINEYPHQFSGGMRQRVMIAIALACNPTLLIADEPTTALDVTIQSQILRLMQKLRENKDINSILLITHNLGIVAEVCDRVIVMYGGKIQETADVKDIFANPLHPYTRGLIKSLPSLSNASEERKLFSINGMIPSILDLPKGCKFSPRCDKKIDICSKIEPELIKIEIGHDVRCHLYNQNEK